MEKCPICDKELVDVKVNPLSLIIYCFYYGCIEKHYYVRCAILNAHTEYVIDGTYYCGYISSSEDLKEAINDARYNYLFRIDWKKGGF